MVCYLSVSGLCVTLCRLLFLFLFFFCSLLQFLSSACFYFAASVSSLLLFLNFPPLSFLIFPLPCIAFSGFDLCLLSLFCQPAFLLSLLFSSSPSFIALFFPIHFLPLPGCSSASCVSEPMVVCAVHPPASHSAPSFLRQYAGHLGRTALRREPAGGLEKDRAYLSLHRTGSLGTHTHTYIYAVTYACNHNHTKTI